MTKVIEKAGLELIKSFDGLRLKEDGAMNEKFCSAVSGAIGGTVKSLLGEWSAGRL